MYEQDVSRRNPGCVIFLVDRSDSMKAAWAGTGMTLAEGAALAAKALGRTDLTILGYDGDTAAIESIAEGGGVTATTNTSPIQMGAMAAQYAIDLLNKKAAVGYINAPTEIVTKENATAILQDPDSLFPKPSRDF